MADLINKDYLSNDGAFILTGVLVAGALIKYAYLSRCGRRTFEELMDPEEAEAQRQQKAAEERLCMQLVESIGPFKSTKSKQTSEEGDVEEGKDSRQEVEGSSDENDADTQDDHVRAFSNACAICLEEFEEGVNVVKSVATSSCPHIFHDTCLNEVILASTRKGIYSIPCPCCRQTFVETDPPQQRNGEVQQ
ncbi:unnamed protein product [Cylindrotheca closterium]|uniref:RING-type domain-containing protein n=1 Tax=Cylindrotheca closterium TaxID=2856 RepID=A0AAD2CSN5_9STRA|nr:unnamed protein product [Cylindrotheca closterium]